jgi:hypothetical protein
MQQGHSAGTAAGTCRKDMQQGHAEWACGMDMLQGHTAWTCSRDMYMYVHVQVYIDMDVLCMYTYMYKHEHVFHMFMHRKRYRNIYLYVVNFGMYHFEFFDEISPKRKETWLWRKECDQKEILHKIFNSPPHEKWGGE